MFATGRQITPHSFHRKLLWTDESAQLQLSSCGVLQGYAASANDRGGHFSPCKGNSNWSRSKQGQGPR